MSNKYHSYLYQKYKTFVENQNKCLYIKNNHLEINEIGLQNIKHNLYENLKLYIIFDSELKYISIDNEEFLIDNLLLNSKIKINLCKSIMCNPKELQYLLFNIHQYDEKLSSYSELLKIAEDLNINSATMVHFIWSEDDLSINNNHFVINNLHHLWTLSSIILNYNSLKLANTQWIKRFFERSFQDVFKRLKLLYDHINEIFNYHERERVMIMGSIILFSQGIRCPSDYDITIKNDDYFIDQSLPKTLSDKSNDYDVSMLCYRDWDINNYRNNFYFNEWPKLFGASCYEDQFYNNQFHYYFFWIKINDY